MTPSQKHEILLQELDSRFQPLFLEVQTRIATATQRLQTLEGNYSEKKKAIDNYFLALEEKQKAEQIINQGEPTV